jgi:hypothetical protein
MCELFTLTSTLCEHPYSYFPRSPHGRLHTCRCRLLESHLHLLALLTASSSWFLELQTCLSVTQDRTTVTRGRVPVLKFVPTGHQICHLNCQQDRTRFPYNPYTGISTCDMRPSFHSICTSTVIQVGYKVQVYRYPTSTYKEYSTICKRRRSQYWYRTGTSRNP